RCTTCNFTSNDTGLLLDIRKTPIIVAVEVLFFLLSTMMGAYHDAAALFVVYFISCVHAIV
ncbi:hypothetical protein M3661_15560, partial [Paenibacillus sp. MER 180]|uniref:hypothetical protein n=1 Tax=Paenibacillus sp. MER 180 TaxID=2939570 RepID=UPI002041AA96